MLRRSRFLPAVFLGLGVSALVPQARAWGPYGHAIVADIAQDRLTPEAAKAATALLALEGNHGLDQVASWPDTIGHVPKSKGGMPETLKWHYVDIDVAYPAYDQSRDCPDTNCVTEKLPMEEAVLADVHASPQQRLVALKWVVHLIGDLHQPLHAAEHDHDKGGNDVRLTYFGSDHNGHMNLHALWDEGVIDRQADLHVGPHYSIDFAAARKEADILSRQITPDETSYWVAGFTPQQMRDATINWVDESHSLARSVAYGALPQWHGADLGQDYTTIVWPIMQLRLEQAGVRLAAVLNAALQGG
ncbi:endonuclease [Neoasaia chiangmaiensis]|uniref:Nuclease n=2 Tax=Neoasaia chiangmaiensis TaxID=320497 RepID=A0A1U9KUF9_9PROT|nr:S1/P1 nuclease [Neoasaia chiangmaiensis]AQS89347.1 nuclease [Neoasaia chiangmaiensis]GEN14215.1 endonuclease [Neoasaia chiangmaiensis]